MTINDIEQLEKRYFNLVEIALKKLEILTQKLISEREEMMKEHEALQKERNDLITAGKYDYKAMTDERKVYYLIKQLMEKERRAGGITNLSKLEKNALVIARKVVGPEGRNILEDIKEMDALETSQMNLTKAEVGSIDNDINELKKVFGIITAVRANPNSKELEAAGYAVQRIEADIKAREDKTKEKIEITNKKNKLLMQMQTLQSAMRRDSIRVEALLKNINRVSVSTSKKKAPARKKAGT